MPSPAFTTVRIDEDPAAAARRVPYPCVLKPRVLSASRGVIRADDAAAFVAAFARIRAILREPEVAALGEGIDGLVVEEFVPGAEVALEGLLEAGRLRPLALFDKPDPLDGPYFEETIYVTPSRWPAAVQAAVTEAAARAAHALGLTDGAVHAELRLRPGRGGRPRAGDAGDRRPLHRRALRADPPLRHRACRSRSSSCAARWGGRWSRSSASARRRG